MASVRNGQPPRKRQRIMNFFRKSHCWPDPALSAGELVDTMGALACWELCGPASEKWQVLKLEIAPHLHEFCDEAAKRVAWTVFMIGPCRESSRPTIVFYSSDVLSRNNVRSSVKESGILERYPGFLTMAANKAPGIGKSSILGAGQHPDTHGERNIVVEELHVRASKRGLAGAVVALGNQDAQYPSCCNTTVGGLMEWHGRYFFTTAAHILDQSIEACFADLADEGEFEFDMDEDFPDDNDSDADLAGITSRGSATRPFITSAKSADLLLDVALFELSETNFAHASDKSPAFRNLEIGSISGNPDSIDVHILTRRDLPVKGRLSPKSTFVTKCAGSESQELWTVRCEERLRKGDSGSWAVDVSNERVYGQVVAGNPANNFVYLVPFTSILQYLEKHLGGEWRALSGLEILHKPLPTPRTGSSPKSRKIQSIEGKLSWRDPLVRKRTEQEVEEQSLLTGCWVGDMPRHTV
ncbi:MAG: hypothetical protein Q9212_003443 [Teloschistes hypoglaucus]